MRHHPQQHARRNHSFLLIFKKKAVRDKITDELILRCAAAIQNDLNDANLPQAQPHPPNTEMLKSALYRQTRTGCGSAG